ncbi:MAG: DUF1501 domain-containing protein, partial [Gammaproteobacteria bacterium]|nr:DUF1501 domain-containing protein [Gammaproteobacteria bacterium]
FQPFAITPRSFNPDSISLSPVAVDQLPRYINIFLYGGPSELAGNLTNIVDINNNSQNAYNGNLLQPYDAVTTPNGQITPNGFWRSAGGAIMEELIASGDMSIYRTMNRIKDDNKGHGACVTQNLLGNLDMESPGIATNLAWILENNSPFVGKTAADLLFPFVTFEGESQVFNPGNLEIPLVFKPVALNSNLQNPYSRTDNVGSSVLNRGSAIDLALADLAKTANTAAPSKITTAFDNQDYFADKISTLLDPATVQAQIDAYDVSLGAAMQPLIAYQNNNFGNRLKAAVSLSLNNPETVFISLGSGGLGGWDDHSEAQDDYPGRVTQLMSAIQSAMRHIHAAYDAGDATHAHNIIINVYGDFGRNVNLNNSMGWDHGNNQNLYTFGGRAISGRGLGKIVGRTERIGTPGVNRQYTSPTADSYQFEPFALASTMYKQFGVTNPELMSGEPPIDETAPAEPLL